MLKRYAFLVLLSVFPLTAVAQITINALPFPVGSGLYVQHNTDNEDGTNTAAIEALIAQSGADQVYDFTGIEFELLFSGEYTVTAGPTGPGAEMEPLNQATKTLILPFEGEDEGNEFEGIIYDYVRETDDAAYNMGGYFEGTLNGSPSSFVSVREPDGDQEFAFPMTVGTMWTSEFVETTTFGTTTFESDFEKEYEVDGWGTMLLPGVEDPIAVLRVKETTTQIVAGFPLTTVCYDLRANGPYGANFCEGGTIGSPTANVTVFVPGATDAESAPSASEVVITSAYPNPAREAVTLEYVVPQGGNAELVLYDVLGRSVQQVFSGSRAAGVYVQTVDVSGLTPGLYLARLTVNGEKRVRPLRVVR